MALQGSYGWIDTVKSIAYGPGVLKTALPQQMQLLGVRKALVISGRSVSKTDAYRKLEAILNEHGAFGGIFTEIGEHSPVAGINASVKLLEETGADFVISLMEKTGAASPIPQIAIPTTLSAAEYQIGAGYTNEEGVKVAVSHPELVPAGIILDAELTLETPTRLWVSTGIRAVDHCVENLYREGVSPPAKILCYAGLADFFKYLPISQADPTNLEARHKLQLASWMSLWPAKRDKYSALGLSHSLGHKLGAAYSIPHGITSCLTLGPVVAFKARHASAEDKEALARCLFYLGEPSTGSVDGDVLKLSALINGLVEKLGLKSTLSQYKVPKEDFAKIAELAAPGQQGVVELLEGMY
ncbi:ATP-dependent DNA helicase PIF1 [Mycena chlorophos]|uniref:ATP-dependent DNA helicase PIF1 n=1 Tax=Mycena chlorophos TaxID=658473 RepID=A0A8H6WD22_MYCCL|nr:ATP-dependent DNA helicase PIF1 [Mycena chlorophos]